MENEKDYTEIDLVEVFHVILDNARNIFVVTLCCVLIAAAYVFMQPKASARYTSETLLRIKQMPSIMQTSTLQESTSTSSGDGGFSPGPFSNNQKTDNVNKSISTAGYGTLNLNQRLLTYAEILKSKSIMEAVTEELGVSGTVAATPVKDTEMMKVTFTANDAGTAQKGNELLIKQLREYVVQKEQSETRYINETPADPQSKGSNARAEVVITNYVNIEVVDPPTLPAASAAGRNKKRTLAVSALLGILLGSGYAVMHYLMNRKITTRQDVEDYLGLPVLAVVPEGKSLAEAMARQNDESVLQKIGGLLWKEQN